MGIAKRLKSKAMAAWLGPTGDTARRIVDRARQALASEPRRKLEIYFEIADPWSYVTAQAVARLVQAYPIDISFRTITPPASDVDAAPNLRPRHAVRDVQQLAEYWDIEFSGKKEADPGMVRDVGTALVRERPAAEQLRCALELSSAMWSGDKKQLAALLGTWGTESHGTVAPILNEAYAELRKAGHYQGAMIRYGGEWYWGIDRLSHLEQALARDLGVDIAHVVSPRPQSERGPLKLGDDLKCEMWFSFRSPYSYLALEQIEHVLAPYEIPLVLRPIPPMVARGLPVPPVKRFYIVRDAKREADRLGIPFGKIYDPLGDGVDNCLAIVHWAITHGGALPFIKSAMRGIWSEAMDVADYVDLRAIVERAGLAWDDAKHALEAAHVAEAAKQASAYAADLAVVGLWGVPSFRIGDFIAWGNDRLPLIADRLRRHALATSTDRAS